MKKIKLKYVIAFLGFLLIIIGLILILKNMNEYKDTVLVLFKDENDKVLYEERVKKGEVVLEKIPQERKEKVFIGWYFKEEKYDFNTPITKDIVLIGYWEEKYILGDTNIVTFYSEGQLYETQEVVNTEIATRPEDPLKKGYQFLGWYQGESLYNFSSPVVKNIELTAKFKEIISNEEEENIEEPSVTPPSLETPEEEVEKPPEYVFIKEKDIDLSQNSIVMRVDDTVIIEASIVPDNATIKDLQIYCESNLVCYIDNNNQVQVIKSGQTNIIVKSYHGIEKKIPITIKPIFMDIKEQDGTYFIIGTDYEKMSGTVTLRYEGENSTKTIYISKETGIPVVGKIAEIIKVELDD